MQPNQFVRPANGEPLLIVGTNKGVFLLAADRGRKRWQLSGPHLPGHIVYAAAYDGRQGRNRLLLSSSHFVFGTTLRSSDDFGKTWSNPEAAPLKFPEDTGQSLKNIWQITVGREQEPETLYCGVEPAALFASRDSGQSWSLVRGLFDHPHRAQWQPGGGGLCLHTVLLDPSNARCLHIAVSTGGVYRTEDDGATWKACNKGITAEFMPNKYPEFGQCVHKVDRHPSNPKRLFLQNHGGLFRSDDGGDSWKDIADGVPSDFGFPMVVHPHDPDTAYIFPLDREMRCGPDGKARVYRTRNGGKYWEALSRGLPQRNAYETVLRDAMTADALDPAGIYFGTRSGRLFGSRNEGNSWELIAEGLPQIVCVKAAIVGEAKASPRSRTRIARAKKTLGKKPTPKAAKHRK